MARVCQRCNHSNLTEAKFCLQCGAMLEVDAEVGGDPLVGKILLGRYRVAKVLGEGGMGKVYLAEQKMGTAVRKVAIKTLLPELGSDPQLVARFHRECETVIELHHPNTVQFYDFGELDDKTLFIVMEFIEGEDLAHVLQRGSLEPMRADRILIQICGSLNEAHQRGIVHRDLKPENVLLTQRGGQSDFVKVLDFGIAKRNEAEDESKAKLTKQGTVLGTPPYMSPEQFSGQALDLRSDVYSLGVMTYEMVTGQLPFEGRTPWEWATKHLTQAPAPLESHPQGATLPQNKKNAIMRALAKAREQRHSSVIEFMQEFTGIHDAQAAWTMATSAGLKGGITPQQVQSALAQTQPQQAVTPAQLPQAHGYGPATGGTGSNMPSYGGHQTSPPYGHAAAPMPTPSYGHAATPFPTTQPQMMAAPATPSRGGAGKWIGLGVFGVLAIAGSIGAYLVASGPDTPAASNPATAIAANLANSQPLVPNPIAGQGTTGAASPTQVGTAVAPDPTATPLDAGSGAAASSPDAGAGDEAPEPTTASAMTGGDRPAANQPSAADLDRARSAVRDAESAIARNDVEGAIRALSTAQRAVGRSHSSVSGARTNLTRIGGRAVGLLVQQNKCGSAQALYRSLRSVGADSGARGQFVPGWCDRP